MPGKTYATDVSLYVAVSYVLKGTTPCYEGVAVTPETNNEGVSVTGIRIEFPETTEQAASGRNLSRYIPAPVRGGTPVAYFFAEQYWGSMEWKKSGDAHSGLFEADVAYMGR